MSSFSTWIFLRIIKEKLKWSCPMYFPWPVLLLKCICTSTRFLKRVPARHKRVKQDPPGDEFYKGRLSPYFSLSFPWNAILRDCLFDWWSNSTHQWILCSYKSTWEVRLFIRATEPELATCVQRNNKYFFRIPSFTSPLLAPALTLSIGNRYVP